MDTGEGRFVRLDIPKELQENAQEIFDSWKKTMSEKYPASNPETFQIGEQVELKGSIFRITRITPKKLILKLLMRPDNGK